MDVIIVTLKIVVVIHNISGEMVTSLSGEVVTDVIAIVAFVVVVQKISGEMVADVMNCGVKKNFNL